MACAARCDRGTVNALDRIGAGVLDSHPSLQFFLARKGFQSGPRDIKNSGGVADLREALGVIGDLDLAFLRMTFTPPLRQDSQPNKG